MQRVRRRILIAIVAVFLIIQVYKSSKTDHSVFIKPSLNIVTDGFAEIKEPFCTLLPEKFYGTAFHICTIDKIIKNHVRNEIPFEEHPVKLVQSSLRNYPRSVFLDIGSNMGIFSLAAAKRGHQVVAVDFIPKNIAVLHKSAVLNNVEENITLINNAISDVHQIYHPALEWPGNNMATRAIAKNDMDSRNLEPNPERTIFSKKLDVDRETLVNSVTLMDILSTIKESTIIIKIDVEGFECKALTEYLLLPDKPKYIPYLFVETALIQTAFAKKHDCPRYEVFLQGFSDSGYEAFAPNKTTFKELTELRYENVFWKHKTAKDVRYLEELQRTDEILF